MERKLYTLNYYQPDEYRFSLDSIEAAWQSVLYLKDKPLREFKIADMCSGCGVIGLEIFFYLREIKQIDFFEVQECYQTYFDKNIKQFPKAPEGKLYLENYRNLEKYSLNDQYDFIVCNPPYFIKGEGLESPNQFKNRCRFFIDANFEELLQSLLNLLKINGVAFVLMRSGMSHGKNMIEVTKQFYQDKAVVELKCDIRGTHLVQIKKLSN